MSIFSRFSRNRPKQVARDRALTYVHSYSSSSQEAVEVRVGVHLEVLSGLICTAPLLPPTSQYVWRLSGHLYVSWYPGMYGLRI